MTIINFKEWLAAKPEDRKTLLEKGKVNPNKECPCCITRDCGCSKLFDCIHEYEKREKMANNCGCFEEEIHHKILDIGYKYYNMQQDPSQEEFLNKLHEDTSASAQRIIQIMALSFDEWDLYMAKRGLPRDHFKDK